MLRTKRIGEKLNVIEMNAVYGSGDSESCVCLPGCDCTSGSFYSPWDAHMTQWEQNFNIVHDL